jgi:hypothetical protein
MATTTIISLAAAALVLAALLYRLVGRRTRPVAAMPAEPGFVPGSAADPARALFAAAEGEPPTEDAIAQARLGGVRGAPQLGAAPMVRQQADNIPHPIDDGHVA